MSDLPLGWADSSMGEVADLSLGKMLDAKQATGLDPTPYLRNVNVRWGAFELDDLAAMDIRPIELERVLARCGDVIVCEGGEPGRSAVWSGTPVAIQKALHRVRPRQGMNSSFLAMLLRHHAASGELGRLFTGTTIKHLPKEKLQVVRVPCPPTAEQERIVTAIEEAFSKLDAGEAALRATRQRLKRLRESVLAAAVTGRLVPQDPTDEPASKLLAHLGTAPCDSAGLPELPHSWEWARLGAMGEVVGGVTKDAKRQDDPDFVEVPYLRVANVQRGFLDLGTVATIRVSAAAAQKLALVDGDVLFNEGGDRDKLGRGWVWQGQVPGCIHQNHVFRSRLAGGMQPKLVSWWGNTFGKGWFEAHGKQTTNLASLNITTVKSFPVPVAPVNEQERIVAAVEYHVSFIDACERTVDLGLVRSAAMRRSILKAAFEGRLVPQDPSDERASVLLDRIEAERDAVGKVPKPHRTLKPQALTPTVGPIADRA